MLTGRSSGSGSDEEYDEDAPRRPLFAAADIYMDQTDGVFELYGALPLHFTEYAPREEFPDRAWSRNLRMRKLSKPQKTPRQYSC